MKLNLLSTLSFVVLSASIVAGCSSQSDVAPGPSVESTSAAVTVDRVLVDGIRVLVERDGTGRAMSELSLYLDGEVTLARVTVHAAAGDFTLRTTTEGGRQTAKVTGPEADQAWMSTDGSGERPAWVSDAYAMVLEPAMKRWSDTYLKDPMAAAHYNGRRPDAVSVTGASLEPKDWQEVACHFVVTAICQWVFKSFVPVFVCAETTVKVCDAPPPPTSCGSGRCDGSKTCTSCPSDCGACHSPSPGCTGGSPVPYYC